MSLWRHMEMRMQIRMIPRMQIIDYLRVPVQLISRSISS